MVLLNGVNHEFANQFDFEILRNFQKQHLSKPIYFWTEIQSPYHPIEIPKPLLSNQIIKLF